MSRCIVLLLAVVFQVAACNAATADVKDGELTIGGIMVSDDLEKFREIFAKNKIEVVHFDNCMGGDVTTGYELSKIIRQHQVKTIAHRQTHSSCAYAYLAGAQREFSGDLGAHVIMLHGARNVDPENDVATKLNPALRRYLVYLTGGKLTAGIANLIEHSTQLTQGVAFVSYKLPFFSIRKVFYCNGSEGGDLKKCDLLKEADPLMLGIITSK